MKQRPLRLGTRRSTLAWAQSLWVAERLQALREGVRIELTPIETRGDRITDVPLRSVEGKEFFSAELDAALLERRVDLTVHSLKDLSLDRPAEIALGAVPQRENPRDVLLFSADAPNRLRAGQPLRIGTSAPRRLENLPPFLATALPGGPDKSLEFREIRGNVDTRLGRLHEQADSERKLEGVILAFAGLIRLWRDHRPDGGRDRLRRLLSGIRWMVLPLSECPAAPGQGALAVECRRDNDEVLTLLRALHDEISARQVADERSVLAHFGGGCHQAIGATRISHPSCGDVMYLRGRDPQGQAMASIRWLSLPESPVGKIVPWDGLKIREASEQDDVMALALDTALWTSRAPIFIAHSRALPPGTEARLEGRRVWTSGIASWRRLAQRGVWVEGCADGLGYDSVAATLDEPVLGLPALAEWQILTHAAAIESWPAGEVIGTYALPQSDGRVIPGAAAITHVFWASGSQFRQFHAQLPAAVQHACGPGRTAELIRSSGPFNLTVFPSVHEWRRWLKIDHPADVSDSRSGG